MIDLSDVPGSVYCEDCETWFLSEKNYNPHLANCPEPSRMTGLSAD